MIAPPRPPTENSLSLLSSTTSSALSSIKSCKLSSPQFLNTHAPFIKTEFPSNKNLNFSSNIFHPYPNIVQQMKLKNLVVPAISEKSQNLNDTKPLNGNFQDISTQAASIQNLLLESLKNKQHLKRKSNNKSPQDITKMKKKN